MAIRTAKAQWDGNLQQGRGTMSFGSGAWSGAYSFQSRFEEGAGHQPRGADRRRPRGLLLDGVRERAGQEGLRAQAGLAPPPTSTSPRATAGFSISTIELKTEAEVPGIDPAKFQEIAEEAKKGCPVSKALAGTEIKLDAKLAGR